MNGLWAKLIFTTIGIALSSALAWLVIFPYFILPQIGISNYSLPQLLSLMLVGFIVTFIIAGAAIRTFREFAIIAAVSGLLLKVAEMITAFFFPMASQTAFKAPFEFWTIDVLFSILFSAMMLGIGLPFGWLVRRFRKPDLD